MPTLSFPLTHPWTPRQWSALLNRSPICIPTILRALGLLAPEQECRVALGLWIFDDAPLDTLSLQVSQLAKDVATSVTDEEVARKAADEGFLEDEIGALVDGVGRVVWGREGVKARRREWERQGLGRGAGLVVDKEGDRRM